MVHQKLDIERIQVSESEDINSIWLVVTEEDIITSDNRRNGVGIDRQTLIGCVENMGQGGEEALVRQIISVKNKFHPAIDMMLVFVGNARAVHIPTIISAGVGASESFSKNGMTLIVSPNVRYNLNEEEDGGLVTVRQDKRLCVACDEGFRTSAELLEHKMSTDHSQTLVYQRYQKQKHRMLRTPHRLGLEISVFEADPEVTMDPEYNIVYIEAKPNETKQFKLRLRNVRLPEGNENLDPVNDPKGIILDRFGLMKKIPQTEAQFVLEDSRGLIAGVKFRLKYNKRITVAVKAVGKQIGLHQVPVLAGFYHETHSDIQRDSDGDMAHVLSHMGIEIILNVKPDRRDHNMNMREE